MKSPSVVLSICATALLSQGCATAPPIHIAAANGQLDQVQRAAEKGTDLNLNSGNFGTPLHQAAINGHTGIAEWLLSQGAKIDSRSTAGTTPLYEAVHHEHEQMTQLLLAHNANPNLPNNDGFAPLHLSLSKTNRTHALTKRLLEAGADPNAVDEHGTPALCLAVDAFDLPVVEELRMSDPPVRLNCTAADGRQPSRASRPVSMS